MSQADNGLPMGHQEAKVNESEMSQNRNKLSTGHQAGKNKNSENDGINSMT